MAASAWTPVDESAWKPVKEAPKGAGTPEDYEKEKTASGSIAPPLTDYGEATKYGLSELGGGIADVGRGIYNTFKPPETTGEKLSMLAGPEGLPIMRTAKGLYGLGKQAMQVPGAIRDLYHSPDPIGSLALVAPRAAGQGATQAAIAAAPEAVPPMVRGLARGTNAVLKNAPEVIGAGAGAAIGKEFGHPGYGAIGGAALARRLPVMRVPGENFGLSPEATAMREIPGATRAAIKEGSAMRIPLRVKPEPQSIVPKKVSGPPLQYNTRMLEAPPQAAVPPVAYNTRPVAEPPVPRQTAPPPVRYNGRMSPSSSITTPEGTIPAGGYQRMIATPEDVQAAAQLKRAQRPNASERGMSYASGQIPPGGGAARMNPRPLVIDEWRGLKRQPSDE